ncbi:DUF4128 domain-containing protein [Mesorhizobium sp. Z1-4]|uniref:DUF4128 domain-containing protein n=1 Tax=Mesorhizobium sp. Z1-4 TaxID=2448478 RepID=UPI000FD85E48|nr:DUF4128 domain-containing protein [Mesorhizobium sp. Z1-4]
MPTTIEARIEKALLERVNTITVSPALPIAWPNVNYTPSPSTRYLRVNHIPNRAGRVHISSTAAHRRYGVLQMTAFLPKNGGPTNATELAGAVAAHFPADHEMTVEGVTVRVTEAPSIAQALPDDTHWMVPITVPYECWA